APTLRQNLCCGSRNACCGKICHGGKVTCSQNCDYESVNTLRCGQKGKHDDFAEFAGVFGKYSRRSVTCCTQSQTGTYAAQQCAQSQTHDAYCQTCHF